MLAKRFVSAETRGRHLGLKKCEKSWIVSKKHKRGTSTFSRIKEQFWLTFSVYFFKNQRRIFGLVRD